MLGNQQQQQFKQPPSILPNIGMPIACKTLAEQAAGKKHSESLKLIEHDPEFDTTVRMKELKSDCNRSELVQFIHQWQNKLDKVATNWPASLTDSIPVDLFIELADQTQTNLLLLGQLVQQAEQRGIYESTESTDELKSRIEKLNSALQEYALLYKAACRTD